MPPTPPDSVTTRPSAVVNEEIRALVARAGGWLYGASRRRYEVLVAEWTVAVAAERIRGDVVKAA
jgi:outer membrane protein TolC